VSTFFKLPEKIRNFKNYVHLFVKSTVFQGNIISEIIVLLNLQITFVRTILCFLLPSNAYRNPVSLTVLWNVYGDCDNYATLKGHSGAVMELHYNTDGR
jgi:hypothetical protein